MSDQAKRLLLIDLSHLFWTTWHATAGQDIDAAFRVTLERVTKLRDGFDAVAIACDIGPSWRKKLYPEYKAGRPERDPAAYDQMRRLREQLEADGLPVLAAENYEADDIIATLAAKASGHGYETTIATGDKDLLQLVGGPIKVLSTNSGGVLMGPDEVREKYGVEPRQLGDFLALVGDKSDNIQGLPGCGKVNAARLLTELGSISNMLETSAGITPPSIRDNLIANKDKVLLARKLVALSFDVLLDFEESIKPCAQKTIEQESAPPVDEEPGHDKAMVVSKLTASIQEKPTNGPGNGTPSALVLDKQDPRWTMALEPRNAAQLHWFAERLFASQIYRKFPNAAAIEAVILRGRSMGIDMMTSLDVFYLFEGGKPAMQAMPIIGLVISSGKAEYFELVEEDDKHAVWATKRIGGRRDIEHGFSVDDAIRAGIARQGGNWYKWPGPMCRKQAGVELARMVYPDVAANIYCPEELGES